MPLAAVADGARGALAVGAQVPQGADEEKG